MRDLRSGVKRMSAALAGWLYPRASHCLCCGDPRRAAESDCLCDGCRAALKEKRVPPQACNRCLSPLTAGKPCSFCRSAMMKNLTRVYAPYRYAGEVRQLIHAFKFDACGEALPLLADAMADALPEREFDCLTPVPLHKRRLRQRGFNQSLLLCRALSEGIQVPTEECLTRTAYHQPQSRLPMNRRASNVRKAFSAAGNVQGKRILLVDDVRTSGSTAAACAEILKRAGAASVSLCVCAVVYRKK